MFSHSKFVPVFLEKNCQKKLVMAIFDHSKFMPIFLGKIVGKKNAERPLLAILSLYQSFWEKLLEKIWNSQKWQFLIFSDNFSVHITLTVCNGLESNEICTSLDFWKLFFKKTVR